MPSPQEYGWKESEKVKQFGSQLVHFHQKLPCRQGS